MVRAVRPGYGSLEASRGSYHVSDGTNTLTGEQDIFGNDVDTSVLAACRGVQQRLAGRDLERRELGRSLLGRGALGRAWSGGGASWAGAGWAGAGWAGAGWAGASLGRRWLGGGQLGWRWLGRGHLGRRWLGRRGLLMSAHISTQTSTQRPRR